MPPMSSVPRTVPMPPLPSPPERPGMYKHASRSMVNILGTAAADGDEDLVVGKGKGKEEGQGEAPAYDGHGVARNSTLKRRRSMPEIMAAPPPYTMPLFPSPFVNIGPDAPGNSHPLAQARIVPRDDEGRETLPGYSNDILLRGVMPRKMEFTAPGVQAKDRKWRRVVCELEGTVFRVYRCAGEGWWERRLGAGDLSAAGVASSAAQAVAAVKAREAAREGAQEGKIAGEEARMPAVGAPDGGEGSGQGTTEVIIPPRSSTSSARSRASSTDTSSVLAPSTSDGSPPAIPTSRSRLNLGLSLLKPRSHGRSRSDLPNPPKTPITSRSSLSIPRPSFSGSSSPTASGSGGSPTRGSASSGSMTGMPLAPSRSNVSLVPSARSGLLSAGTPVTPASSKGKHKSSLSGADAAGTDVPEPDPADLIRAYTLQHAESGLGNDYLKRKHVIRVRLEGEQFLLQARDVGDVVDWIEGLHCASNIALDLDERVMPKGPLFPRRRRRRPRTTPAAGTNNTAPAATT
ncbi:hypothetical protein C8R43DRAFT_971818 [Mycena crocata]|nr:hypothetical protein C8R43DRAFT_971818 [Mycena crocata]